MRQRSEDKFGQLVMVPEIRFAHAAALRLLEPSPPAVTIYGPAGAGKSHLVRHILREITRQQPESRISQITADNFSAEFARASQAKTLPEFRESQRGVDVFVCEDLQVLEGRPKTQSQLLAILDELLAQQGRVLLTSNKSPGALSNFSSKLKNRCQGGVCAAIELLSQPSRKKLLLHFASERGFTLSPDVAALLADSLAVSARELRAVVCRLELLAHQERRPIDHELAQAVISDVVVATRPTLSQITKAIAKAFSVSPADLKSEARVQGLVLPRQLAMFAAKEWTAQACSEIGKHFGRRSHSTIVYACQRIRQRLAADPDFRQMVETIQEQLKIPQREYARDSTT